MRPRALRSPKEVLRNPKESRGALRNPEDILRNPEEF